MKTIIASIGSDGDLIPMLGVGVKLQAQGHDVTILCGDWQMPTAESYGLRSHSILTASQFDAFTARAARNENEWIAFFLEAVLPSSLPTLNYILQHHDHNTLLIGSCHALGLKLAQEKLAQKKLELKWLSTHLQPPADVDGESDEQKFFDRLAGSKINIIRRRLELPPLSSPFSQWMMSCQQSALFYPYWFSQYNDSQVQHYTHVGFPFIDDAFANDKSDNTELPETLDLLLAQDTSPLFLLTALVTVMLNRFLN